MAGDSSSTSFSTWLREPQTLIGLSAIVLSVCGLSIAIYEASLYREAQQASVWPHVEVGASMNARGVDLWAENTGVGPARIQAASLSIDEEAIADWSDLLNRVDADLPDYYQSLITGRVLPATTRESMFRLAADTLSADTLSGAAVLALRQAVLDGDIDVSLCYCSVYDTCWTSRLQDTIGRSRGEVVPPEAVETCEGRPQSGI
ncbi:MAG: hypothetical protein AAF845_13760 [Bacteroidota bacterium]